MLTYADRGGDLLALYVQVQCVLCLALGVAMWKGPVEWTERYSVYLLYWYKSTNNDTCGR